MGICSSCLGRRGSDSEVSGTLCLNSAGPAQRRLTPLQQSDTSQLLGDGYQPHYGTLHASSHHPPQPDPEEIRREREELEQICTDTSK